MPDDFPFEETPLERTHRELRKLESSFRNFLMIGGSGVNVEGDMKFGYAISQKGRGGGGGGGGAAVCHPPANIFVTAHFGTRSYSRTFFRGDYYPDTCAQINLIDNNATVEIIVQMSQTGAPTGFAVAEACCYPEGCGTCSVGGDMTYDALENSAGTYNFSSGSGTMMVVVAAP